MNEAGKEKIRRHLVGDAPRADEPGARRVSGARIIELPRWLLASLASAAGAGRERLELRDVARADLPQGRGIERRQEFRIGEAACACSRRRVGDVVEHLQLAG